MERESAEGVVVEKYSTGTVEKCSTGSVQPQAQGPGVEVRGAAGWRGAAGARGLNEQQVFEADPLFHLCRVYGCGCAFKQVGLVEAHVEMFARYLEVPARAAIIPLFGTPVLCQLYAS